MKTPSSVVVVLLLMFLSAGLDTRHSSVANAQDAGNAAVKYLRADASLRQSYALAPDGAAKLQKALEAPLDDEDEKLVAAADEALTEFHHAADSKRCDWDISNEDGALANTAHRGSITELVSVSGIRARLRFRGGDISGAMSDATAAMAAARHLTVDGSLASVLIGYRLESAMAGILARNLYRFSPAQLDELASRLQNLPRGSTLGMAFEAENVRRRDLLAIGKAVKSRDDLIALLLERAPILQGNRTSAATIVDECGGTVQGYVGCVQQQQSFTDAWTPKFGLPPEEFESAYKAEIGELSRKNPIVRKFTPSLPRLRWVEAYCQTRRALLLAAIAVQRDGVSGLNRHVDPYDGKPFTYTPEGKGFRLASQLSDGGVPIALSVPADSEHAND
jgi:hypothetical protein